MSKSPSFTLRKRNLDSEADCDCVKIIGHLENVHWQQDARHYRPSPGPLALDDWAADPFIWLHYVISHYEVLLPDQLLLSKDTRFWDIKDVQRYFRYFLGNLHCEDVLFTYQYPNLGMKTALGSYLWKSNIALKIPSRVYEKTLHHSIITTLKKLEFTQAQMNLMIISDQLVNVDRLDYFSRKTFFRLLRNIFSYLSHLVPPLVSPGKLHKHSGIKKYTRDYWELNVICFRNFQDELCLVSLENLSCKRMEGVRLIQQLASFNAKSLKYLYLWRFVLTNENPILINYSYIKGSGQYIPRHPSKQLFIRSLALLKNLRVLAIEYAHIADGTGGALMTLLPVLVRSRFRLQLMCREDQVPGKADPSLGVGGLMVPDTAWRRVTLSCPNLYLFMAFFRIRDYDNIRRFLTPSMPINEIHLQLGIDIKTEQRQDSDISCFFRHIAYQYGNCLDTLIVHQWRFAYFPLRRVLELMPRLVRFTYIGRVEDEVDLKRVLQIVASGVCHKLEQIKILIQDDRKNREYWQQVVEYLNEEFTDIMQLYEIKFCIDIYKE